MDDYTNYCTPEQTERAYKLGAPIRTFECDNKIARESFIKRFDAIELEGIVMGDIPTTQQMIGWLREKGLSCQVYSKYGKFCAEVIDITEEEKELRCINEDEIVGTYEKAELAAINTALNYLEKGE